MPNEFSCNDCINFFKGIPFVGHGGKCIRELAFDKITGKMTQRYEKPIVEARQECDDNDGEWFDHKPRG